MRAFTSSFTSLKNSLDGEGVWAHLVELVVNVNTTAFFTTAAQPLVHNGQTYIPIPMNIGAEEQSGDGTLPRLNIAVSNYQGLAFQFAKDNDLSLNDVTIRLVNTTLPGSGSEARIKLQILGSVFSNDTGLFVLGHNFNYDAEGPLRTWNRRDYPGIPYNFRNYGLI